MHRSAISNEDPPVERLVQFGSLTRSPLERISDVRRLIGNALYSETPVAFGLFRSLVNTVNPFDTLG